LTGKFECVGASNAIICIDANYTVNVRAKIPFLAPSTMLKVNGASVALVCIDAIVEPSCTRHGLIGAGVEHSAFDKVRVKQGVEHFVFDKVRVKRIIHGTLHSLPARGSTTKRINCICKNP